MKQKHTTAGDLAASAHRQFQTELQRYLVRRLRSDADAADLAQEVYLRLLRLKESERVREPLAYVFITASRLAARFMRRAGMNPVQFDSEAIERLAEDPDRGVNDDLADQLSDARLAEAVLNQLPAMHRSILVLRERDEMQYSEIAEQLGISIHTVKKYLHEARARLAVVPWIGKGRNKP